MRVCINCQPPALTHYEAACYTLLQPAAAVTTYSLIRLFPLYLLHAFCVHYICLFFSVPGTFCSRLHPLQLDLMGIRSVV